MANVYLSFLGASDYDPCTYFFGDNFEERDVRFVQEATVKLCCADWTESDRIRIFTTEKALATNWTDDGHRDRETGKPLRRVGLERRLAGLGVSADIANVWIPDGRNEPQIWDIFRAVVDELREGDNVVFDITHGFRSIPMLALVVLHYAKAMEKISIEKIVYGAFEAEEDGRAPIFDLTQFDLLFDWSLAIDRFLETGDAVPTCKAADRAIQPLPAGKDRDSEMVQAVNELTGALKAFSLDLATCRGPQLSGDARDLKSAVSRYAASELPQPLVHLLEKLKTQLSQFDGDETRDGIRAARWCLDHNLIQQGFTILQETLITWAVKNAGLNSRIYDDRKLVSMAVNVCKQGGTAQKVEMVSLCRVISGKPGFPAVYDDLRELRNDMNHAGYGDNPGKPDDFETKLGNLIGQVERLFGM